VKLLVGMLSCGENERQRAIDALKAQSFRDWDFFEIRDQPNREAHRAIYRTFMDSSADCYLKLDADMVLREDILGQLVEGTRSHDLQMVFVDDWPSLLNIPGMQIFSHRCKWPENNDPLNVDTTATHPSPRLVLRDKRWVIHMPDPHDFQSFRYGVHKALKMLQRGVHRKSNVKAAMHHSILCGIWKNRAQDRRRDLMIIGAESVFSGKHVELFDDYAGAASLRVFNAVKHIDASRFAGLWDDQAAAKRRALELIGRF
jgi:hypothetical protein